jgi:hypothetical protein
MPAPPWFESFFGPDYFEIYRDVFSPGASAAEAEGIGRPGSSPSPGTAASTAARSSARAAASC